MFKYRGEWYLLFATSASQLCIGKDTPQDFVVVWSSNKLDVSVCQVAIPNRVCFGQKQDLKEYFWTLDDGLFGDPLHRMYGEDAIQDHAEFAFLSVNIDRDDAAPRLWYMDMTHLDKGQVELAPSFNDFELPNIPLAQALDLKELYDGNLYAARREGFQQRTNGSWRDFSTRSQQQPRSDLLRQLAREVIGNGAKAHNWMYTPHLMLDGMRPENATCTFEGTVKAIKALFADHPPVKD